jgi:Alpha/beta hydrolase domain
VVKVDSEAEALRAFPVQVDDTEHFRWWQVAGTGHGPGISVGDLRALYARDIGWPDLFGDPALPYSPMTIEYALRALSHHLGRWVADGTPAPSAPPLVAAPDGTPDEAARDERGNALGGLRLPHVEAPVARYHARNGPGDLYAMFAGAEPFDVATLARLYPEPGDHEAAVAAATDRAVAQGFVLAVDAPEIVARARATEEQLVEGRR